MIGETLHNIAKYLVYVSLVYLRLTEQRFRLLITYILISCVLFVTTETRKLYNPRRVRFIMFFMIRNIYNKKTKGPTLIELFTAIGKLKKFFFCFDN
jgi:hypothetical protein